MDAVAKNSTDLLPEDIWFNVFDLLDAKDLLNCELVCRKWQIMIRSGKPWKTFFQKKMISCPVWIELHKNSNTNSTSTSHYRDICRSALHFVQVVDKNWCTRKFTTEIHTFNYGVDWYSFTMNKDYFAFLCNHGIKFVDRDTMEVKQTILPEDIFSGKEFAVIRPDMLFFTGKNEIRIFDTATGQKTKHMPAEEDWNFIQSLYDSGFLAVVSHRQSKETFFQFSAFAVKSPSDVTSMMNWTFEGDCGVIYLDENYAVFAQVKFLQHAVHRCNQRDVLKTIHFVSTKSFEIERSLSLSDDTIVYDKGLLLTGSSGGRIRIFDVASGTFFHNVSDISWMSPWMSEPPIWNVTDSMAVNSKYFILAKKFAKFSRVRVYDFDAIRNPDADRSKLLVTSFDIKFQIHRIYADECQLVCMGTESRDRGEQNTQVMVLDFKSLNATEQPEAQPFDDSLSSCRSLETLMRRLTEFCGE